MTSPDWDRLELAAGILREPALNEAQLLLWVPGSHEHNWDFVCSVPSSDVVVQAGLNSVTATVTPMRQIGKGRLGKFLNRIRGASERTTWTVPNGSEAEQAGERTENHLLVWSDDDAQIVDQDAILSRWPEATAYRKLGPQLFLVSGVAVASAAPDETTKNQPQESADVSRDPIEQAQELLAAARANGERAAESSLLVDLGILCLQRDDNAPAIEHLEQAVAISRELADRPREHDALGQLAMAFLQSGQPERAYELFEKVLSYAREVAGRFAEKATLNDLGLYFASVGDPHRALESFAQSLEIDGELGDRHHQADVFWNMSTQHDQLGQHDHAVAAAQSAVDTLRDLGDAKAEWFAQHLERYRAGTSSLDAASTRSAIRAALTSPATEPVRPAGILQMALSATQAMAKFLASGLKTVESDVYEARLDVCGQCEHHTGVRCRLCGCFTSQKAKLPHENCPIGNWPE